MRGFSRPSVGVRARYTIVVDFLNILSGIIFGKNTATTDKVLLKERRGSTCHYYGENFDLEV